MDGPIVTEEEITANKGASTFQALERTFFGVCGRGGDVSNAIEETQSSQVRG